MQKTVYLYDPETLKPLRSYDCYPSPLEPGEYIIPVHSLPHPPPTPGEGQAVYFNRVDDWTVVSTPVPTPEDVLAAKVESYRMAARQHMSDVARSMPERFNSISEAKSFAGVDNPLRAVSEAAIVWAASVQTSANATLDAVLAGTDPLPALDDFIASLPAWSHP
jgi:hypothetical protein